MSEINRSLLVVKPKQPFLDWVHSLDDERYALDYILQDSSAYLIPQLELLDEQRLILEYYHAFIFSEELASWYTDEAEWPEQRDLKTFLEWFDLEFHSLVFDLDRTPIKHIEYGADEDDVRSTDWLSDRLAQSQCEVEGRRNLILQANSH